MNNIPPFAIGQRIVCLRSKTNCYWHSCTKDQIYTVYALTQCSCGAWKVDIGVKEERSSWTEMKCEKCNGIYERGGSAVWADASYFAPVHTDFQSITLTKVIEIETPLICIN